MWINLFGAQAKFVSSYRLPNYVSAPRLKPWGGGRSPAQRRNSSSRLLSMSPWSGFSSNILINLKNEIEGRILSKYFGVLRSLKGIPPFHSAVNQHYDAREAEMQKLRSIKVAPSVLSFSISCETPNSHSALSRLPRKAFTGEVSTVPCGANTWTEFVVLDSPKSINKKKLT